ncbi:MAG: maltose alpha-D-glucosyltransferase [Saprospiraceae bacterium]|nr:maltose alpha-D-glucosyltransferase [Lewinella sp.]
MTETQTEIDDHLHWYKDAIIYELHIKAFMDHNGDGIGDFNGLLDRLDYLEDLGVTAIWLLPFYPSPLRDDGYDIADYYSINPSYGKIKHFKKFIKAAHERNLKVITELVINHTSDQHPWFQRARSAPKGSVERDYYVWSDDPKKYQGVRIIFQDYEASNWSWDPVAKQYYWHRFFHHQPDLNYDNPRVQEEVFNIMDYWMKMGVDGFRLDAVPYLFEREGTNCENLPQTHAFLKKLRKYVDEHHPGKMLLAEANMWPEDSAAYFGEGDECHMNYHFPIMPRMFMAMRMEDRYPITDIFDQTPDIPQTCQWAIFLRNHDELTLEMVTDEERDYMYKVYAKNPKARINLGIRQRLAPLMENNRKKIELINCLLFSLPGTPVIYYGDEIGMGDNYYLGDRDGVRTPMQWSPDRNAGFSKANPQQLYLPVILDPEYHYGSVNVETQQANSSSLLWWTKRMINMRKRFNAFGRGNIEFIHSENPRVLVFTRSYKDETILVVVNLSRFSQVAELDLNEFSNYIPIEVFSRNKFPAISEHRDYVFTLSPHAYYWFLLKKEKISRDGQDAIETIVLDKWEDVLTNGFRQQLENGILPAYLIRSDWFTENGKEVHSTRIIEQFVMPCDPTIFWLILEVNYESGLPDVYQIALSFKGSLEDSNLMEQVPEGIIAPARIGNTTGFLFDGLSAPELHDMFFQYFGKNHKMKLQLGTVRFYSNKTFVKYYKKHKEHRSKLLHSGHHNNISILHNNTYYLKIYRKLDQAINSDQEMIRFLSEQQGFPHIPQMVGGIELLMDKGPIVLGTLQNAVEHQGETWMYLLDDLKRYYESIQLNTPTAFGPMGNDGATDLPFSRILPDKEIKARISTITVEHVRLLGERVAELHLALAADKNDPDFAPEEFSLHYQRSLFSSFQSLVRKAFQSLERHLKKLPEELLPEVAYIKPLKQEILNTLKQVYQGKMDVVKIRTHGDLLLTQVLFTGRDFVFVDFEGDPTQRYSERRLKRSPLRDVATMIRSFHYVAYEGLFNNNQIRNEEKKLLRPWADKWFQYMSRVFLKAYLSKVKGTAFVPDHPEDLDRILDVFLLEQVITELEHELKAPYKRLWVPLSGIRNVMQRYVD